MFFYFFMYFSSSSGKGSKLAIFNWLEREPEIARRFELTTSEYVKKKLKIS